jgi:hypothetical protein
MNLSLQKDPVAIERVQEAPARRKIKSILSEIRLLSNVIEDNHLESNLIIT